MKKLNLTAVAIISLIWLADAVSKFWAVQRFSDGSSMKVLGDYLQLRLVYNTGGVFGIFQGNAIIFHILSGLAILFLLVYYLKSPYGDGFFNLAISFILGGALGNFTDRFFRPGVVDFIDMGIGLSRWPTFNVADAFISVGAVILLISFYLEERRAKKSS